MPFDSEGVDYLRDDYGNDNEDPSGMVAVLAFIIFIVVMATGIAYGVKAGFDLVRYVIG